MDDNISENDQKAIKTAMGGGDVNAIGKNAKGDVTKEGSTNLPKKTLIIQDFKGKILKRDKSIYLGAGNQPTIKKGTKWEDIKPELKNKISFSNDDFENKKGG